MSDVVFSDTPFGEFLESAGEPVQMPPGTQYRAKGCLPLELDKTGSLKLQRHRFRALIHDAMRSQLGDVETSKFLEKFRYALVSSQLLEPGPRYRNETFYTTKESHKMSVLYGNGPWDVLKMKKRFWVGSGGGAIVVIVRVMAAHSKNALKRGSIIFLVCLCTLLYLFAHSRRRSLRLVRAKAITFARLFIDNNYKFDKSVGRCMQLIQEVELLAHGYRPDLAYRPDMIPGARLEQSRAQVRTAKSLRSAVCAAFFLVLEAYQDSLNKILPFCDKDSLFRYINIYELASSHKEVGLEFAELEDGSLKLSWTDPQLQDPSEYYGPSAADSSLNRLRSEFRKVHCVRRTFICTLLVMSSSSQCSDAEFEQWYNVVDQLEQTGSLVEQMANTLSRDNLLYKEESETAEETVSPQLSLLFSTMSHLESRIQLLRENIDYQHNYHLLGEEIKSLLDVWDRGKMDEQEPGIGPESSSKNLNRQSWLSSATLVPLDEQSVLSGNSSYTEDDEPMSPREELQQAKFRQNGIFEALSDGKSRPRSTLSRDQRIALMKETREFEAKKLAQLESQGNFVKELDSVLERRS